VRKKKIYGNNRETENSPRTKTEEEGRSRTHKKSKKRAPEQVHTLHVMTCPAFRDSPPAIKVIPLITFVITYLHLYPKLTPPYNSRLHPGISSLAQSQGSAILIL
jgi:hypothetical protein